MDDQLYNYYLEKTTFTRSTKLRIFHNGSENDEAVAKGLWFDEHGVREYNQNLQKSLITTVQPSLLLFCATGNGRWAPLTISSDFLVELLKSYRMSQVLVQSMYGNKGSFAYFVDFGDDEANEIPLGLDVVSKVPYSSCSEFSFTVHIDIRTGNTTGIIASKQEQQLDAFLQRLSIRRSQVKGSPLALFSIFLEEYSSHTEAWRADLDSQVVKLESAARMTSLRSEGDKPAALEEYEKLTWDLHSCNSELVFLTNVLEFEVGFGEFCEDLVDGLDEVRREAGLGDYHGPRHRTELMLRLKYSMNSTKLKVNQTLTLKKRIESQINLLYSLISQRDSKVNVSVAEDSKWIALAARQDSRMMRTIGLLTLTFLPGTLVASIFSAGVINLWENDSDDITSGKVMAPLWWVFALTVLIFTLFVLLLWWIWNGREWSSEKEEKRWSREKLV